MARPRMSVRHHIPELPRPQEEYNMFINNLNQPFEHVWLQRSQDGTRVIHPLEHFSASDFIDVNVGLNEPIKPLPLENTPFKLVEDVKELKQLAAKLLSVNEFAVDLEHNHYRSFQGITCLMQISTRTEDFVVDTLKLRVHVGPYLREVFKDPSKKKIMHGAECDIVWLQRDFGIYLCNLFDTQQASRVLELERNSLEYLMLYFCGIAVDKSCQRSDWRLRPLPDDMLKYAREDTHYLLYIYDLMRGRLVRDSTGGSDLLLEVYRRSYDVCMRLYEKELLTDTSYLYIYGLHEADFNSQQLSIVAGLFEWRDAVARAEDESTGYILPNRVLLEIAREMPLTVGGLHRLVKAKHPYVEVNLDSIVNIIKSSVRNAAAFESAAELLKKKRQETVTDQNMGVIRTVFSQQERIDDGKVASGVDGQITKNLSASLFAKEEYPKGEISECSRNSDNNFLQLCGRVEEIKKIQDGHSLDLSKESFIIQGQMVASYIEKDNSDAEEPLSEATEKALDWPSYNFGLENAPSSSKPYSNVVKQKGGVASFFPSLQEKNVFGEDVDRENGQTTVSTSFQLKEEHPKLEREIVGCSRNSQRRLFQPFGEVGEIRKERSGHKPDISKESFTILGSVTGPHKGNSDLVKAFSGAAKEALNNPGHNSGLVNLTSKFETDSNGEVEQIKLMNISAFQSFIPSNEQLIPVAANNQKTHHRIAMLSGDTQLEERALVESYLADQEPLTANHNDIRQRDDTEREQPKLGAGVETASLSLLSSRFWKCFQLKHEKDNVKQIESAFDYAAGMGQNKEESTTEEEGDVGFKSLLHSRDKCNNSVISRFRKDEVTKDFQQAKQYLSFMHAGN